MASSSLALISEVKDLQDKIDETQNEFKSKCEPPDWLEDAESAFKWSASLQRILTVVFHIPDKLEQYKNQGSDYGFEKISFLLPIIVQYSVHPYDAESSSNCKDESIEDLINSGKTFNHQLQAKIKSDSDSDSEPESESIMIDKDVCDAEKNYVKCKEPLEELFAAEGDLINARIGPALPHVLLAKRAEIENKPIIIDRDIYDPEKNFAKCKKAMEEMEAAERDSLYIRIGPALQHVVLATRAHMLYLNGNIAESKEIARNIQPVNEMSIHCRAGIEGLKSKFQLTFYRDLRVALESCQKAIELDPECGYWHYLAGKILRRLRRNFKEEFTREEVEYFEKAVEHERNPKYLVFLAQTYQETAKFLSGKKDCNISKDTIDKMLRDAVELYRECWSLKNDSIPIGKRLGAGLSKMSSKHIDINLAREVLQKTLEMAPDGKVNHCLAKFYYIHEKDDEKALDCLKKMRTDYGHCEIIRINLIKDPNYDPVEIIKKWEEYHTVLNIVTNNHELVGGEIGWYYLYFKNDLYKSVKSFWKILMKDPKAFRVMEFSSYSFCLHQPQNMIHILCNEIMLKKEKNEILTAEEKKEMDFLESFLRKMVETHPEVSEMNLRPDLMEKIRRDVKREISILRERRYGPSFSHKFKGTPGCRSSSRPESNPRNAENQQETRRDLARNIDRRSGMLNTHDRTNRNEASGRSGFHNTYNMNRRDDMRNIDEKNQCDNRRNQCGMRYRGSNGGGGRSRYNSSNRYDVTIENWREENKTMNKENH